MYAYKYKFSCRLILDNVKVLYSEYGNAWPSFENRKPQLCFC